ncbi:MAG: hypothetical protein HOW97_36135 [Catenulispora sp.]|nr:hypothetical protein [Catenulispora sp.]
MSYPTPFAWHAGTDTIAGRAVKRYHIGREAEPIRADWEAKAAAMIPDMLAPEDGTPPAAFTVLFRSGAGLHLNVYSWYWDNVLYAKFATGGVPILGSPDEDPGNLLPLEVPLIGCVYELGVLVHERSAWIKHMLMPEKPDMDAYLADVLPAGPIGLP